MDETKAVTARPAAFLLALAASLAACAAALADFGPDGADPRGLSLAGTMTTEAEGPAGVYWNPARLAFLDGSSALLSLGSMQRPDHRAGDFGGADRFFAGASFGGGDGGALGRYGIAAAISKPWPKFSYSISRSAEPHEASQPSRIDATVGQVYSELLLGAGIRVIEIKSGGARVSLDAGLSAGLGISLNSARATLTPESGPGPAMHGSRSGTSLAFPGSLGLCVAIDSPGVDFRFGAHYRGVLALSNAAWLELGALVLDEKGLFMPPPQQGSVAAGMTFFDLLTATVELSWSFFDVPDAFQGRFPNHYPTWKFGFEYKAPFGKDGRELALRTGISRSVVPDCKDHSIYASDTAALHAGWGFTPDGNLQIDVFLSALLLTGRRAGTNSVSAGMSCGFSF